MTYFGIGGKTDPNQQSSSHIMNDSNHLSGPAEPRSYQAPKVDVHQDVMAFERKLQYDKLVHSGVNPVNAIRQVVPTVKSGVMLTPKDIKNIIDTGQMKKSRIG